jgi:TolB protein
MRDTILAVVCATAFALACNGDGLAPEKSSGAGRIAFQMRRGGVWDIYTVAADGSDLRNLTRSSEDDVSPAWSRDSRRLAFVSARAPAGIYVVNADGGDRRLIYSGMTVVHLTWSPDGARLALQGTDVVGGWDIYLINVDGTGLSRLTATNGAAWAPDWSPDGSRIAFHTGTSASDIITVNVDGTGRQNLTPNTATVELDPVWSPDGSRIAFVSTLGGSVSLYTMKADGTDWRRVTVPPSGSADRVPDWSPDGAELAFQRETFPTARVYGIRADGSGLRAVADTVSGHPAW